MTIRQGGKADPAREKKQIPVDPWIHRDPGICFFPLAISRSP